MPTEPDEILVENIKNFNCEISLETLVSRHSDLFYKVCQRFAPVINDSGIYLNDILEEKYKIFYDAATLFKKDKGAKFSSWLGNYTRYCCLNLFKKHYPFIPLDQIDFKEISSETSSNKDILDYIHMILSEVSDERVEKIFNIRYFNISKKKPTWKEIGKSLGISGQTCINIHNKYVKILNLKLKSEELFDGV